MTNKKSLDTYLNLCSEYYDLDKPEAPSNALNFYFEYAQASKGLILEPMCGTGRFMIPMLEHGFNIEGFDASSSMLDRMQQKCSAKNLKPFIWQGLIEEIKQQNKYDLIFIPSGSFGLIIDDEQIKKCLLKIWNALTNDGIFVFEVETLKSISNQIGIWKGSVQKRMDGKMILLSTLDLPLNDNISTIMCRYDLINDNAIIKTEIENFRVRLYDTHQLTSSLREMGFKDIKLMKAFDHTQSANDNDEVAIFECRK